jgi:hypothetical protein
VNSLFRRSSDDPVTVSHVVLVPKVVLRPAWALACAALATAAAAGCGSSGSSGSSSSSSASAPAASGAGSAAAAGSTTGAGALSAEARSAATGDIPDNQVFLLYSNPAPRYSMKYPEGWTVSGSGNEVTMRQKNNVVHIVVESAPARPAPTTASVASRLQALKSSSPTLTFTPPQTVTVSGAQVIKTTYTTRSAPDPVTNRSVLLIVDRYVLQHGGRTATVDLGTQQGVDNVDAYRKMIESFHWS